MEEKTDPNKPPVEKPTPEVAQLLKILDIQAASRRTRRPPSAFQAPAFRYGILIAIVVFTFASLGILEWFLSQLPKPARSVPAPSPAHSTPATP
jgi:hypothetical protein